MTDCLGDVVLLKGDREWYAIGERATPETTREQIVQLRRRRQREQPPRSYGAAIIWLRDFYPPQIVGSTTRYAERWNFWIAGDRATPFKFDDTTIEYELPFITGASGGDRRFTWSFLDGEKITFNAGLAYNVSPASEEPSFQIAQANTYTLAARRNGVRKSPAAAIPYGDWIDYLTNEVVPDACVDFLASLAASKVGPNWYLASISIPSSGERQDAPATFAPIRSPSTAPITSCALPSPAKYARISVYPVNVSEITSSYVPIGTVSISTVFLAFPTRLLANP